MKTHSHFLLDHFGVRPLLGIF